MFRRLPVLVRCVVAVGAIAAAVLAGPAAAAAAAQPSAGVGLPLVPVYASATVPPGFTSSADQAIRAAEANPTMQALHRRQHPLWVQAYVWNARRWYIDFTYRGTIVAEVDVSPAGRVAAVWTGPLARAIYARGHFAPLFSSPWVLVPFSLLFLVPFLDPRRRRVRVDALLVLSLLVSYVLFVHARLEAAVWLIYPPLIALLRRMLLTGVRRPGTRLPALAEGLLSERALWIGLLALVAARVVLSLAGHTVIDVGYASVIGADRLTHGQSLYYAAAAHSDTYGPIVYLAYAPFELAFPWHGLWDSLPAAHAATIAFDLVTIGGLVLLGRRLAPDTAGRRLGVLLAWAWAACPFTLLGVIMHTNDGLIAMLVVLSLLAFRSPAGRGALLGLSAAAKFAAAALLPLYAAAHERSRQCMTACVAGFGVAVGASLLLVLPGGGLSRLYDDTIAYQLHRTDVFSAFALHPGLGAVKVALEVLAVALAVGVALLPGRRSLPAICALAAAVTIALQLPSTHWFYYYAVWFLPYLFVAVLAPGRAEPTSAAESPDAERPVRDAAAAPGRALTRV
jgi:hypothetical protein